MKNLDQDIEILILMQLLTSLQVEEVWDGGPVENRLKYIPDLLEKSFLDIGTEEGYSVFNAINKNAKFAKGLNINESKEYDYFPDTLGRLYNARKEEIEKTQKIFNERV